MQHNIDAYQDAMKQATDSTNSDTKQLKELTAKYEAALAQYQAEKARVDKENAEKKAAYEKALSDFMNGTNVNVNMDAHTDTDMGDGQYKTMMTADVNSETGEFTLKHDMNDGNSIIGQGVLTGKIIFTVVSNGDGTETITVTGIELYKYIYTNLNVNTANNKNINFHVYDNNGNELFAVAHDGQTSFEKDINKTFNINQSFKLTPGQQSSMFSFLKIADNWIYNTHGQVEIAFTNTNKAPDLPDYEPEPTAPDKVQGEVTNYSVTQLPKADTPKAQEATVTPYKVTVDPESAQPAQPKPAQVQASLPETGMEQGLGLSGVGFALLAGMAAFGTAKKRKKDGEQTINEGE
ncbi:aggregation substance Asa1/PrgB [Weissella oryzae SG25]|uniref:Aggregation substance Asa1/PrgB n=1 Tax=Weissella oryzae (strain DSM 25784 / JCM 18191 / LMG 30913 / SG25) TaxID=1329250 RepID=A0A069CX19_WEIOS|nr:LPXTG cell wall anchor domain-containing protein [Weissella oryzae]GAK31922.1 aggregation substance Asa1/PrgB [Weissella oryzae SG25]